MSITTAAIEYPFDISDFNRKVAEIRYLIMSIEDEVANAVATIRNGRPIEIAERALDEAQLFTMDLEDALSDPIGDLIDEAVGDLLNEDDA